MSAFNSTSIPAVTRFEHLSNDDSLFPSEAEIDMNDYFLVSTTPDLDHSNKNETFVPYFFNDYKPKDDQKEFLNLIKPLSTLAMPPFSWMLHQATQTQRTTSPRSTTMKIKHRKLSNDFVKENDANMVDD